MKDEKKILKCDECNTILKTGIPDQDSRGFVYCRGCGLCYEPGHVMGRGLRGLNEYMISRGLNDYVGKMRIMFAVGGLAKARLYVSKL